ncbi:MAG: DUF4411 family protein [Deltaproteobacteria bacterium]|jgi:hypothetical protein|nr:DUF4411 family protein [Deltaproteobacteria bacterium]
MNKRKKTFLVDTNILITPFHDYYSFDFGKNAFWNFLEQNIMNDNIKILSNVYAEITKGKGELEKWITTAKDKVMPHNSHKILNQFNVVMKYLEASDTLYEQSAVDKWADPVTADGWLVATSMAFGYSIVTFETRNKFLGTSISDNPKIPDIAAHFGVKCINLFDMMRSLNFKFDKNYT